MHEVVAWGPDDWCAAVILFEAEATLPLRPSVRGVVRVCEELGVVLDDLQRLQHARLCTPAGLQQTCGGGPEHNAHADARARLDHEELQEQDARVPMHETRQRLTASLLGGSVCGHRLHVDAPEALQGRGRHRAEHGGHSGTASAEAGVQRLQHFLRAAAHVAGEARLQERQELVEEEPGPELPLAVAADKPQGQEPAAEVHRATADAHADAEDEQRHKDDDDQDAAEPPARPRAARHRSRLQGLAQALPDLGLHVLPRDLSECVTSRLAMLH
mmetsp:Transcript_115112/g.306063  ORF Transcript_115112/g.306063 Transcript_115112/m.306063 type:complete len:273 (+) Transcript_115112:248-1066(+)